MSSGPPEFPGGLPVLFFYEDPEEKRERIEGAKPPRPSVPLPHPGDPGQPALEYPLLRFPWEPWRAGLETQSGARAYATWLSEIAAERLAIVVPLLAEAGAPVARLREDPAGLDDLGQWMQGAFPVLAVPEIEQGFLADERSYRLGWAFQAHSPGMHGYSRHLDALTGSVAHDLALIVADCAAAARPGLAWQSFFIPQHGGYAVGFDPERPEADLIGEIAEFLTQTAARPRGVRGHELRTWFAGTLRRGYDRAVSGTAVPQSREVFADAHEMRGYPRWPVSLPAWPDPGPPPPELVAAVEVFRAAGWFETVKRSSSQVARGLQAAWRAYEGEDLPLDPGRLYGCVLKLDNGRTWSDDVDAAVQPGDGLYDHLVDEVSVIRGKALGRLWSQAEDWTSRPGDLVLSLRMRAGKRQIVIPAPGPYLSAAVFTGLNDLTPADGPRLWFVDQDAPVAVVTRATPEERAALQDATGLRLDPEPPAWWTSLAPLPAGRPPVPASGPRERPASGAKASGAKGSGAKAGRARKADPAAAQPTAQAAFDRMMRTLVAPALHELGFTGSGARWLSYRSGDYTGSFGTQKSRYSTREAVEFWVHLGAAHEPTSSLYWNMGLLALLPGDEHRSSWTVRADSPAEPVAADLLDAFRRYGWPAIQAAVDSPGYPPDPVVTWPRSFGPPPSPAALGADGPNLGPLTWPLRRTGHLGDLLDDITDPDEIVRFGAVGDLGLAADQDPGVVAVLLGRLERDPSPAVRGGAARGLRLLAAQPEVGAAFRAAGAQDEDVTVRWWARYALRLAADQAGS